MVRSAHAYLILVLLVSGCVNYDRDQFIPLIPVGNHLDDSCSGSFYNRVDSNAFTSPSLALTTDEYIGLFGQQLSGYTSEDEQLWTTQASISAEDVLHTTHKSIIVYNEENDEFEFFDEMGDQRFILSSEKAVAGLDDFSDGGFAYIHEGAKTIMLQDQNNNALGTIELVAEPQGLRCYNNSIIAFGSDSCNVSSSGSTCFTIERHEIGDSIMWKSTFERPDSHITAIHSSIIEDKLYLVTSDHEHGIPSTFEASNWYCSIIDLNNGGVSDFKISDWMNDSLTDQTINLVDINANGVIISTSTEIESEYLNIFNFFDLNAGSLEQLVLEPVDGELDVGFIYTSGIVVFPDQRIFMECRAKGYYNPLTVFLTTRRIQVLFDEHGRTCY